MAQLKTAIASPQVLKERGLIVDETPINGITMPDRLVNGKGSEKNGT